MHIVHIMPKDKFAKSFVCFNRENILSNCVDFVFYGRPRAGYESCDGTVECKSRLQVLFGKESLKYIHTADCVVVNWADPFLSFFCVLVCKKTYLMFWGGDIYSFSHQNGGRTLGWKIERRLLIEAIKRADAIITLVPEDLAVVESLSSVHGEWFLGSLGGNATSENIRKTNERISLRVGQRGSTDSPVRILVGNNATESNRHISVLRDIARFASENIVVFCPLSYGSTSYADAVTHEGNKLFGEKFVPIKSYFGFDDYQDFLSSIDIAVFNNDRQQAMGNINSLLRYGAKLYLAEDSALWSYYHRKGIHVYPVGEIASISFHDFSRFSDSIREANRSLSALEVIRCDAKAKLESIYRSVED